MFSKVLSRTKHLGGHHRGSVRNAGLEITEFAEQTAADLDIIPSHGYQGVKRMLLGSVAERVIRHVPGSVLVLRRSDAE